MYRAKEVSGSGKTYDVSDISEIILDGKPATLYSEVGAELSVDFDGVIYRASFGPNTDKSRSGTIHHYNRGDPDTYFKGRNSSKYATIHLHPKFGASLQFKGADGVYQIGSPIMGPSITDYQSKTHMIRNVVIDDKYIYLINRRSSQDIIFKR